MRSGIRRAVLYGLAASSLSVAGCSGDGSSIGEGGLEDSGPTAVADSGGLDSGDSGRGEYSGASDAAASNAHAPAWPNGKILSVKDVDLVILDDETARGRAFDIPAEIQGQGPFKAADSYLGSYCLLNDLGRFVCSSSACASPPAGEAFADLALSTQAILGLTPQGGVVTALCGSVAVTFPESEGYVQLEARDGFQCALHHSGRVHCFGPSTFGPFALSGSFVEVAVGTNHVCGLSQDGRVSCFNRMGRSTTEPEANPPSGETFKRVTAGSRITCGIRAGDGSATCWGNQPVADRPGPWVELAANGSLVCGVLADGKVSCWSGLGGTDQFKDLAARLR